MLVKEFLCRSLLMGNEKCLVSIFHLSGQLLFSGNLKGWLKDCPKDILESRIKFWDLIVGRFLASSFKFEIYVYPDIVGQEVVHDE